MGGKIGEFGDNVDFFFIGFLHEAGLFIFAAP
jgi:hypothetical protein